MSTTELDYDVVVLGAGVLGLSTALELTRRGVRVAVVARDLPEDLHSTGFASPWAGANWCSFAGDDAVQQGYDRTTFHRLGTIARDHPELVEMIPFWDVVDAGLPELRDPWYGVQGLTPDYKRLGSQDVIPGAPTCSSGISYRSYIFDAPAYLLHLARQVREQGVPIVRARLSALSEAYNLPAALFGGGEGSVRVQTVVNATGLGAGGLVGVDDRKTYPIRGQTVLVRAPEGYIKRCIMQTGAFAPGGDPFAAKETAYIIPRAGSRRHVILGGSYGPKNHNTVPDLALAERILQRAFALDPSLAARSDGATATWRDIEVVSHNVGLRPAREGGVRVELERIRIGGEAEQALVPGARKGWGRDVRIVHAYGIGPAGYQASVGIAERAAELVMQALDESRAGEGRAKARL